MAQLRAVGEGPPPVPPPRYFERAAQRYYGEFSGGSASKKVGFLLHCLRSIIYQSAHAPLRTGEEHASLIDPPAAQPRLFRVAINLRGSLGDFLQAIPAIERFCLRFAPLELDIFTHAWKQDARTALASSGLPWVRQIADEAHIERLWAAHCYDLLIEARHIVRYRLHERSLPRAADEKPGLLALIAEADKRFAEYRFIFDRHPQLDGLFARLMVQKGLTAVEAVGYFMNIPVDRDAMPSFRPDPAARGVLERFALSTRRYVTVHDGYEVDKFGPDQNAPRPGITRSWPIGHWAGFVAALKARVPEMAVVQVGTSKTGQPIPGVDTSLLDKTTLDEAAWVIKSAALHVDTESGLVRVASATGTPVISVQGPSGSEFFRLPDVDPIVSSFRSDCFWVESDWMTRCALGLARPECMYSIGPDDVAERAARLLSARQDATLDSVAETTDAVAALARAEIRCETTRLDILIVGDCEAGLLARIIARRHRLTLLVEAPTPDLIAWARAEAIGLRLGHPLNIPFARGRFDVLVAGGPLAESPIAEGAGGATERAEFGRVLRPEGVLLLRRPGSDAFEMLIKSTVRPAYREALMSAAE